MRRVYLPAPLTIAIVLLAAPATAAGPLGAEGSPLTTSDYRVDYFNGPVLSSARVAGLGGAFHGIAEGIDAVPINPAAVAVRPPWSYDWFDYDATAGLSFPGILSSLDFENVGDRDYRYSGFLYPSLGLIAGLGRTGVGGYLDGRVYGIDFRNPTTAEDHRFEASFVSFRLDIARAFWRGQLSIGIGLRLISFSLKETTPGVPPSAATRVETNAGAGFETGLLLAPVAARWRLGVTGRLPVSAPIALGADAAGDLVTPEGLYLPRSVEVPWGIEVGFAWELGRRPLNPMWINPDEYTRPLREEVARARKGRAKGLPPGEAASLRLREDEELRAHAEDLKARRHLAYTEMPRSRWLLTAALELSGPVASGVGPIGLLQQRVVRSGDRLSVTPRLGFEAEPIAHRLQARIGAYVEPARLTEARARVHATAGLDLNLFEWTVFGLYDDGTSWCIGAVVDVAERYTNLSLRVGRWR